MTKLCVRIITDDKRFERMLSLELSDRGVDILKGTDIQHLSREENLIYTVTDLDFCSSDEVFDLAAYSLVIGFSRLYKNELGGTAVVFAGNTEFPYNLVDAFGYLDEARKQQLVTILEDMGVLPVYYPDDAEVLMKAARMKDGRLLCAILDMSLDVLETVPLVIHRDVTSIKRLMSDGSYKDVAFEKEGDRYTLATTAGVFDPVVLVIE